MADFIDCLWSADGIGVGAKNLCWQTCYQSQFARFFPSGYIVLVPLWKIQSYIEIASQCFKNQFMGD